MTTTQILRGPKQVDEFFEIYDRMFTGLTYGDMRLRPGHSKVLPKNTNLRSRITRNIPLLIPFVSSPMDTVTEADTAIGMALLGGMGVIHRGRGMPPHTQAKEVAKVKYYLNGFIERPISVRENEVVSEVLKRRTRKGYRFHRFPVVNASGKLVGIVTKDNFDLCVDQSRRIKDIMTPLKKLKTAPKGTTIHEAFALMRRYGKKAIPLVDGRGKLAGLYVFSDLKRILSDQQMHNLDAKGHLRVGAAVGAGSDYKKRARLCAAAGCDLFQIDTAHGHSDNVARAVRYLKKHYPHIDVLAGNVSDGEGALFLINAGADGILVGQGPGSICTTRMIAGIGVPQGTAVHDAVVAARGTGVPICADGGITVSGDVVIALAIGAESVMVGKAVAGTDESPGEVITIPGLGRRKFYRGMGSLGAMRDSKSSRDKYRQEVTDSGKVVPEGADASVPYQGPLADVLFQYVGGVRLGLGYTGSPTITHHRANASFIRMTPSGLAESRPHDVMLTEAPPNYRGGVS